MKNKKQNYSNVKLFKDGKGYFLEIKDDFTTNRLAITESELFFIYKVVKEEVLNLLEEDK